MENTEFKGTKGEWEIVEHSWSDTSIISKDKVICTTSIDTEECNEDNQDELSEEMITNFKLIRASQDLLEALQNSQSVIKWLIENCLPTDSNLQEHYFNYTQNQLEENETAIKKALGE